jgi:hypothetical protein
MDAEGWNSGETKGSKGRKGTWFRTRTIEEEAQPTVRATTSLTLQRRTTYKNRRAVSPLKIKIPKTRVKTNKYTNY